MPILILIVATVVAIFLVQNAASVELRFLLWTLNLSQALLIFFVLVTGIVVGWSLHAYVAYRRRRRQALSTTASMKTGNAGDDDARPD